RHQGRCAWGDTVAIRSEADMNEREDEWRRRLLGRSLVVEAGIEPELVINALHVLADNVGRARTANRDALFRRYPAILVGGLCAIASTHYDDGTYWPNVPAGLRVDTN